MCPESLTGILEIKDSFETSSKMVSEKIPAFDFPRCIINRVCDVTKTQILFEVQERVLMADGPGILRSNFHFRYLFLIQDYTSKMTKICHKSIKININLK